MPILVTGSGGGSGIATLSILKEMQLGAVACDMNPGNLGKFLADKYYKVPAATDKRFIGEIIKIIKSEHIGIIFPNVDEELLIFSKNRPIENTIVSDEQTIRICSDKLLTYKHLQDAVMLPEVYETPKFPAILKPRTSRGSRNVHFVRNKDELNKLWFEHSMLMENLPGKEYTVDAVFDRRGKLVACVPRERIVVSHGISIAGRTVQNLEIISQVEKISGKFNFFGPVNMQFKEDIKGCAKLVEINPRASGGMLITYASGFNPIAATLKIINNDEISESEKEWKEGIYYSYPNFRWFDENCAKGRQLL